MNSKSYAVVFTKETSFCIVRKGMLEVRKITEEDEDEKKFITYSVGVQVPCSMGSKEAEDDSIR